MAANEDDVRLRLTAETLGYRKAWADVRVQTARDLSQIKASVTQNLNQARVSAAQSLSGIRVNTAAQLAQIRVNTAQQLQSIRQTANQSLNAVGSQFENAGRRMTVGLTLPLVALAGAAVKSARDIDQGVNTLRAFTGSAEAAEKRLAQLIATAQKTPGLTTRLALTLDAQLRAAQTAEQTIDRILPAIGRISAVSRIEDPARFTSNLIQLVTQSFERRDLKELVGASPIAGQIIRELFNVDSPINAQAIRESAKRMGIKTVDSFFAAFADAASRNQGLANVTESIGTRFDKLVDRVTIALRPLGLAIIDALAPAVEKIVPLVEGLGQAFASLSTAAKTTFVVLGGGAAAVGPLVFIIGSLLSSVAGIIKTLTVLNAIGLLPTITNLRILGQVVAGTASLAAGSAATTAVMATGYLALGAAAVIAGVAVYKYFTAEKQLAQVSAEQIKTTSEQVKSYKEQVSFLDSLKTGVARTSAEQDRLKQIYASLNPESRARVESIKDETGRLGELRAELQRLITLRSEEQRIQAATLSANLSQTLRQAGDTEAAIDRATARISALSRAREELERSTQPLSREQSRALGFPDLFDATREQQLVLLERRIQSLIALQADLRKEADKFSGTAREQSETLQTLSAQTGLSERQILQQARAMGLLSTDVDTALRSIEAFRAGQGEAAKATEGGTTAVDEQVESLKQLKRALAEAEIAAKERSASVKRAFDEDRISSREATNALIQDARNLAAAQLAEIDAAIEARKKGLEGADDKDSKKATDEIQELELRRKRIVSESNTEIADLQAEQRRKERDAEEEHQNTLLDIRRTHAQGQIETLRDRIDRDESFRLEGERKVVDIERRVSQFEEDEIRRRLNLVAAGTDARRKIEDDLSKFLADKERQRAEQGRRIREAELANALRPVRREGLREEGRDVGDAGVISRLRSIADLGRATFEQAETQIGKIIDAAYVRKINTLKAEILVRRQHGQNVEELNERLAALEQQRRNSQEETFRAIEAGRLEDLDRAQSYKDRLISIQQGVVDAVLAARKIVYDIQRRTIELRRPLKVAERRQEVEHQTELARIELAARRARVLGEIQDEIGRLERKESLNDQEVAQLKALHEQLKAEEERFNQESNDIELRRTEGLKEAGTGGFFGPLIDEWRRFKEEIADLSAVEIFSQSLGNLFGNLRGAALGAVDAIIFSTKSLKSALASAFRDALAQTAAFLAKKAYMKALEALAEAAMHFAALDFAGGARYLAAAAAWGALGTGVAALGRIAAGGGNAPTGAAGSLADNGAQGAGSAGGQGNGTRTIEQGRTQVIERVHIIHHEVTVKSKEGWFEDMTVDTLRNSGAAQGAVLEVHVENARRKGATFREMRERFAS